MSKTICILGRQPAIGLAELESLLGADKIHPVGGHAVVDAEPSNLPFDRLGGTIKAAKLLARLDFTGWKKLSDYLVEHVPKHTCCIGPGKLTFGISTYGLKVNEKDIQRTALEVKKAVRQSEQRPVRVVPTKGTELNSAQVLHNKMTEPPLGMELIFIKDGDSVLLAQTFAVQDIEAYAARDQARPKRDAKVGMLPPKLAQVIINMATGQIELAANSRQLTVLDPFCGTGVVLQESLLMGYDVIGIDKSIDMMGFSTSNIEWLSQRIDIKDRKWSVYIGDATESDLGETQTIASETYLGRPFSAEPNHEVLQKVIQDVDTIHKKFLQNVAKQTKPGFRMCLAVPAWRQKHGFKHLPTLDHLKKLGYTRWSFSHAANEDLIYHREGQIVGRELVVLIRK